MHAAPGLLCSLPPPLGTCSLPLSSPPSRHLLAAGHCEGALLPDLTALAMKRNRAGEKGSCAFLCKQPGYEGKPRALSLPYPSHLLPYKSKEAQCRGERALLSSVARQFEEKSRALCYNLPPPPKARRCSTEAKGPCTFLCSQPPPPHGCCKGVKQR